MTVNTNTFVYSTSKSLIYTYIIIRVFLEGLNRHLIYELNSSYPELTNKYRLFIYLYLYSHTAKYNGTKKNNNIIIT